MNTVNIDDAWKRLTVDLDNVRSIHFALGGAIRGVQELGLRAEHLVSSTPKTLDEMVDRIKKEHTAINDDKQTTSKPNCKFNRLLALCEYICEWQRELAKELNNLQNTLKEAPDELLDMLSSVRGERWRPHIRRYYVDRLRTLPGPLTPFKLAMNSQDCLRGKYQELSILAPLPALVERFEDYDIFPIWRSYRRRAQSYAHDLYALRSEIGAILIDGPVAPNGWRSQGELIDNFLTNIPWKLVNFLFSNKSNRSASFSELADPVFGDHVLNINADRLGAHRRDANKAFKKHAIPLKLSISGEFITLADTDNKS
jgi:hypothetical protein